MPGDAPLPRVVRDYVKEQSKPTIAENIIHIRNLLENGLVIDKKVLAKINDKMSDHLIKITDLMRQLIEALRKANQSSSPTLHHITMIDRILDIVDNLRHLDETKQLLSELLK